MNSEQMEELILQVIAAQKPSDIRRILEQAFKQFGIEIAS